MDYNAFLTRVIDEGLVACREDYKHRRMYLRGAVAGFEACRGKAPNELDQLLHRAHRASHQAYHGRARDYWRIRCYELEVEWVCNVVSAMLHNQGLPTIVIPTARGLMKAASIIGVKDTTSAEGNGCVGSQP